MRKYVIAGNWKMNKTPAEATALINDLKPLVAGASCDVVVGVPFVDLPAALEATKGTAIGVAAQNCHWEKSGAFTGEVSAEMLKAMEVGYVILGHSERRTYFGDTDVTVQKRVRAALDAGLTVILCVGEYLEQREQGVTGEVVAMQTKIALGGVSAEELARVIIAYEPVWAIGVNGVPATKEYAEEKHGVMRATLIELYGEEVGSRIPLLYGGSVNPENAPELIQRENIDGLFIGRSAWQADKFEAIIRTVLPLWREK